MILLEQKVNKNNSYELKKIKKGEIIPLVSDVMFHTMLNNESRKKYVSYFLSLVLEKDYNEIYENLKFSRSELDKSNYYDSKKTVDLVCEVDGKILNIEMNNNNSEKDAMERNIDYACKLSSSKMKIGSDYNYQTVIQININNFSFDGVDKASEYYQLMNKDGVLLTEKLSFVYFYLPNIRKKYYNKEELTTIEKLLLIFNEDDSIELDTLLEGDNIMEEYRKDAKDASQDVEIIGLYDKELNDKMLNEMGKKRAREEGEAKGAKEKQKEIALEFLKKGVDIEIISECCGLSIDEIRKLENS